MSELLSDFELLNQVCVGGKIASLVPFNPVIHTVLVYKSMVL